MGSACCVAAKDRTITNGSSSDAMPRNIRYSPSWSVRWDNRRRVAGEEASMNWSSYGVSSIDRLDNKSQTTIGTAYASEEGSPLESFRNLSWQKSSPSEGYTVPQSDQSISKKLSEAKGSREAQIGSELSPSTQSVSSFSASPLSFSQGHLLPPSGSATSRWPGHSPGHHLLRQASDSRIPGMKSPNFSVSEEGSPFMLSGWSNESNRGSHGGSSDSLPVSAINELMGGTSHRERWSFDSESLNFGRNKMKKPNSRTTSSSPSIDTQTCGVCSKFISEKSSWGSQKIIATNDLAVVAILICGHVYHAECLENMTSEINKYDPVCPVCTYGEKQALKLFEKALKADMESKAKINNKKSRRRVVDGDMNDDVIMFDRHKSGRTPKLSSSSSVKASAGSGKPFLKRHFSFGSKGSRSLSENNNHSWKKGYFWAKSSKE